MNHLPSSILDERPYYGGLGILHSAGAKSTVVQVGGHLAAQSHVVAKETGVALCQNHFKICFKISFKKSLVIFDLIFKSKRHFFNRIFVFSSPDRCAGSWFHP